MRMILIPTTMKNQFIEEEENISNLLQTTRSGKACRTRKGRASTIDLT
jgi:hypothetical protein